MIHIKTEPQHKHAFRCDEKEIHSIDPAKKHQQKWIGVESNLYEVYQHITTNIHMSNRLYLEKKGIACGWKHFFFKSTVPMGTR